MCFDVVDIDPARGDNVTLLGKGRSLLATGVVMLRVTGLCTLAHGFLSCGLLSVFVDDHVDLLDCAMIHLS